MLTQIVTKLKNSNYDDSITQVRTKLKTQNVTKLKLWENSNSNCDEKKI